MQARAEHRGRDEEAEAPGVGFDQGWVRACPQSVVEGPSGYRSRCLAQTGKGSAKVTRAGGPGPGQGSDSRVLWAGLTVKASLPAESRLWEARGEMLGANTKADRGRAVATGTANALDATSQVEGRRPGGH